MIVLTQLYATCSKCLALWSKYHF